MRQIEGFEPQNHHAIQHVSRRYRCDEKTGGEGGTRTPGLEGTENKQLFAQYEVFLYHLSGAPVKAGGSSMQPGGLAHCRRALDRGPLLAARLRRDTSMSYQKFAPHTVPDLRPRAPSAAGGRAANE